MLCQICRKNQASIQLQEYRNGEKKVLVLCVECAQKRSVVKSLLGKFHLPEAVQQVADDLAEAARESVRMPEDLPSDLRELLMHFPGFEKDSPDEKESAQEPEVSCPCCGWTRSKFKSAGKVGCEVCFDTFRTDLADLMRNFHRSLLYTGKTPPSPAGNSPDSHGAMMLSRTEEEFYLRKDLATLRKSLQEAVSREEYDQAAELRDSIRSMERSLAEREHES